jgi:hypothetical protein
LIVTGASATLYAAPLASAPSTGSKQRHSSNATKTNYYDSPQHAYADIRQDYQLPFHDHRALRSRLRAGEKPGS